MVLFLQKITFITLTILVRLFIKFTVYGKENIVSLKPPVIIVANHKSYFDHWLIGFALVEKSDLSFLPLRLFAADWLFKVWWTGWGLLLKLGGAFRARKGEGLEVSLKEPIEILKNGGTLMFYPEGKIIKDSQLVGEPRRGVGALAMWSGAKILPVAIKGSRHLSKGVSIIFGEPFFIKDILQNDKLKNDESDYIVAAEAIMSKVRKLYFRG